MTSTTTYNQNIEKKIINRILIGIAFVSFLYVFFIGVMSASAARMEGIRSEVRTLGSEISELELEYVSLGKSVTLSYAHSIGFSEPKNILFVTDKTLAVR